MLKKEVMKVVGSRVGGADLYFSWDLANAARQRNLVHNLGNIILGQMLLRLLA